MQAFSSFLVVSFASVDIGHAAQQCMGPQHINSIIIGEGGRTVYFKEDINETECEHLCAKRSDCWSWMCKHGAVDSCFLQNQKGQVQHYSYGSITCGQKKFECQPTRAEGPPTFKCNVVDLKLGPQCVQAPGGISEESCEEACVEDGFIGNNDDVEKQPLTQIMNTYAKTGPKPSVAIV